MQGAFSVVLNREWPGCPAIWVGLPRITKIICKKHWADFRSLFADRSLLKFIRVVILNAVGCREAQKSGNESKRAYEKEHKRVCKGVSERK